MTSVISIDENVFKNCSFRLRSECIDDRRNKRYVRKMECTFRVQMTEYTFGRRGPWVCEGDFKKSISSLTKDVFNKASPSEVEILIGHAHISGFRADVDVGPHGYTYGSVEVVFTAEKPSKIPSEKACLAYLKNGDILLPLLQVPIDTENARFAAEEHRIKVADYATWVAKTVASEIHKRARELCRYDARIAGLNAEFASHVKAASSGEGLAAVWKALGDFELAESLTSEEVFAVATTHLDKFIHKGFGRPGPFGYGDKNIQPDDLLPATDEE